MPEHRRNGFLSPAVSVVVLAQALTLLIAIFPAAAHAQTVVTNGSFTNVYVLPDPDHETWEEHMAKLRPSDAENFSRKNIDKYTQQLMTSEWPSYFDPLHQYAGINIPEFFGSGVASQTCVDAAVKDEYQGILQWDTIRSLSNCHQNGMDPSPQVNLIFSPDFKIGAICPFCVSKTDMCPGEWAWHAFGLNTPNFVALPTSKVCAPSFTNLTEHLSHEVVETLSDPAGFGINFGNTGPFGVPLSAPVEVADKCENTSNAYTNANSKKAWTDMVWSKFSLARYWSISDSVCAPQLDPPSGSDAAAWVLGQGSPLQTLTGNAHVLNLKLPDDRSNTDAQLTRVVIAIQTGGNDLSGSANHGGDVDVTLNFSGGHQTTANVNAGHGWLTGETHTAELSLPSPAPRVNEISGVSIELGPAGNGGTNNWSVNKVALVVSFPTGNKVTSPVQPLLGDWLDVSGIPLVRFTGNVHDYGAKVDASDEGKVVRALDLFIFTGNDDLRGGSNSGDNCDVTVELTSGKNIVVNNINHSQTWPGWTIRDVSIPLPTDGLKGGDVKFVDLHTGFGGGSGGDNWNVQRIQLQATMAQVDKISPTSGPSKGGTTVTIIGKGLTGANKVKFGGDEATHVQVLSDSKLTADSPLADKDEVEVEVSTPAGTIDNAGDDHFTYLPEVTKVTPDSGPLFGGAQVTVEGLALNDKYTFSFGGAAATSVKCASVDKCEMVTPPHSPGKVALVVDASVEKSTPVDLYTYLTPAITSFNPNVGPTTGGLEIGLTGVSLQTGMTVKFGDAEASGVICSPSTNCGVQSPPHAEGSVHLTATVAGVMSAPSTGDFAFKVFPTISGVTPNSISPNTGTNPVENPLRLTGTGFSTSPGETIFNLGASAVLKDVNCASATTCTAVFVSGAYGADPTTTETLPISVTVNGLTSLGSVNFTYPIQRVVPKTPPGQ